MNRWLGLGLLLALAGAVALRGPGLDLRPVHNDEAINAAKLQTLWEKGSYVYNPHEFHGPTLYYCALPFVWLSPARNFDELNAATLRSATVFFGAALIVLLALMADGLGKPATAVAAVLTAISPAMVFYSRYFIHEMLLVFFTSLVIAAGWRWFQTRRIGWALLGGAGVGLMYATKETFVISLGVMSAAAILTYALGRWRGQPIPNRRAVGEFKHILAGLAVAAIIAIVLFTSIFTNPRGLLDSVLAYVPWLSRAGGGSPHIHPWYFYFERLAFFHRDGGPVWSEGLIVILAAVGAVAALTGRGLGRASASLVRFLAFYTAILTLAYSMIPYKTPWCLLSFWCGMILLAGVGTVALLRLVPRLWWRLGLGVILAAAATQLAWQAWALNYKYSADRGNPYVYAQTSPKMLELVERVEALAKVDPQGHDMIVQVMAPGNDYWPLPWYLRTFKHVGWWDMIPDDPYAPVMMVSPSFSAALDEKSGKGWLMVGLYELRPGVFFELYVESGLWRKYVDMLPKGEH